MFAMDSDMKLNPNPVYQTLSRALTGGDALLVVQVQVEPKGDRVDRARRDDRQAQHILAAAAPPSALEEVLEGAAGAR